MPQVKKTILFVSFFLLPFTLDAKGADTINLAEPRFHASGRGDVTTLGSIGDGATSLRVSQPATWLVGHGIRVRRAGDDALVQTADTGWTLPPGAPTGAAIIHDVADKKAGVASVQCGFTGVPPDADGDGTPDPVDLCEVDLGSPIELRFDELRMWVKSSIITNAGDLHLRVLRADRAPTFDLELPALPANVWKEVFIKLRRESGSLFQFTGGHQILTLHCQWSCRGLSVHLDDFWGVKDFVATVDRIEKTPNGGATFHLNRAAGRTVSGEVVYHDDTVAVSTWLQEANKPGGAMLFALAGVYYINSVELPRVGGAEASASLPLYNDTQLRCANPQTTIFKNTGGSETGPGFMFRSAVSAPVNISIKQCGFDWNGWNRQDYGSVLVISPQISSDIVQNVHIQENRFFDSHLPGRQGCEFGQAECATRQRHHVLVQRVDGLWVENNRMSGGGRIKTGGGGLGRNMHIRNNTLDLINDNGITIMDTAAGLTEHVEITDNAIKNPIGAGIFFGADGEPSGDVPGMIVRDVTVARNRITGFFAAGISSILPESAEEIHIVNNAIQAQRSANLGPQQFVSGIVLRRGNAATNIASDIRVEGNTVVAFGSHAAFNVAGLLLGGPVQNLVVENNDVRCDGCLTVDRGIWLSSGEFKGVEMLSNNVNNAGVALLVGYDLTTQVVVTDATILANTFQNSTSPFVGQISLVAGSGSTIKARITDNVIQNGNGYGILCQGAATFTLSDLGTNDFANNLAGNISGCP